jgi:hypothetical protein
MDGSFGSSHGRNFAQQKRKKKKKRPEIFKNFGYTVQFISVFTSDYSISLKLEKKNPLIIVRLKYIPSKGSPGIKRQKSADSTVKRKHIKADTVKAPNFKTHVTFRLLFKNSLLVLWPKCLFHTNLWNVS